MGAASVNSVVSELGSLAPGPWWAENYRISCLCGNAPGLDSPAASQQYIQQLST